MNNRREKKAYAKNIYMHTKLEWYAAEHEDTHATVAALP